MASRNLLLVEGIADKSFFEEFCRLHALNADVKVAPAKEVNPKTRNNGKQAAIKSLPTLLKNLNSEDGPYRSIALVVDADAITNGAGFVLTVAQITPHLTEAGYEPNPVMLPTGGLLFKHTDGLPDFGLWIMPDNASDGMLEDWIYQSIYPGEQTLFAHATSVVGSLPNPKFKQLHQRKAEVATWLAWQEKPGEDLYYAVQQDRLLDPDSSLYAGLREWLIRIFRT